MRCSVWAFAALIATLAVFGLTGLDLVIQETLFDRTTGTWILDKQEPIGRLLLYTGPKYAIIAFGVGCLLTLLASRRFLWAAGRRRALLVVISSLAIIPTLAVGLKSVTNVACPVNLEIYGGPYPHVQWFETYPQDQRPPKTQRCFPAGQASLGFALLSVLVLFKTSSTRIRAATVVVSLGLVMAVYKMAIGDHFASHTLVSLEMNALLIPLIAHVIYRFVPQRFDGEGT